MTEQLRGRVRVGITPNEILNKEFDSKFRGYDAEQVNDFLDIVRADFEKLIAENDALKKDLDGKKDKLDYFSQLQDSLNSSIMVAQDAAERLKQNARKEAELILFEAEREADRLVNEASDQARKIYTETEELRVSSKTYRQRLIQIVESHLSMINDEEFVELFDGGIQTEAFDFPRATAPATEFDAMSDIESPTPPKSVDEVNYDTDESFETTEFEEPEVDKSMPLSRQELEMMANETNSESSDSVSDLSDFSNFNEEMNTTADKDNNSDTPMESVLGQTIRIDLPK